jgi:hypothetical protein
VIAASATVARAPERRQLERDRAMPAGRRQAIEAHAQCRRVAGFGPLDRRARQRLGFALQQRLGDEGRPVARTQRPAARISTLSFLKGHLLAPVSSRMKKPGAVSRPGTLREFQFHE